MPETTALETQTEKGLVLDKRAMRDGIVAFEEKLSRLPDAKFGDCFPLKHTFATGMYIREITMPKGAILTSKIHKVTHPYFVLKGDVSVITERGVQRIKAPYSGITLAGTKRILYVHEETVWTTIHKTDETDLEKIEEEIIAKNFDEFDDVINIDTVETKEIADIQEVPICHGEQ